MKKIVFLVLVVTIVSCKKSHKENQLIVANWLLGTWENQSDQGTMTEIWEKANDSIFNGQAYFIKSKDTLHFEHVILAQKGEKVLYTPTVKGQNNDQPVTFTLTKSTSKQLVFENAKHDYPQKIVYTQITQDSLVATISGNLQGKQSTESYPMKKQ